MKADYLTPIKAIRAKCLDCSGGSSHETKLCPVLDCSLYRYRLGKNPNITRTGGKGNVEALQKARDAKKHRAGSIE